MEIDLSAVKTLLAKLKKLHQSYFELNFDYYNNIKQIDNEWNNIYEKRLMNNVELEKKYMKLVYKDLIELESLYSFIYKRYSEFGNKIKINSNSENLIIGKLNTCINQLKMMINICNSVDRYNMSNLQINALNNMNKKMHLTLKKLMDIKNNISNCLNDAKNIEKDIRKKIVNINLCSVQETDISDCIEG